MRTHIQIITDAGGYKELAAKLSLPTERTRFWQMRKSIPLDAWRLVSTANLATLDELLDGVEQSIKAKVRVEICSDS